MYLTMEFVEENKRCWKFMSLPNTAPSVFSNQIFRGLNGY